ncbi:MAG TPA: hypothetical protein VF144_21090 [Chitinophagaceae bacterium]
MEKIERGVVNKVIANIGLLIKTRINFKGDNRGSIKKISPDESGEKYVDGLVSTGK